MNRRHFIDGVGGALAGFALSGVTRGDGETPNATDDEAANAESNTFIADTNDSVVAEIVRVRYQRECQLLLATVQFMSNASGSRWLVDNGFVFARLQTPGGEKFQWTFKEPLLTIDLSQLPPTKTGIIALTGDAGAFGFVPITIELSQGDWRYFTYAFQSGVLLSQLVSDAKEFNFPDGARLLQLRFGVSREPFAQYSERVLKKLKLDATEWNRLVTEEWQTSISTEPAEIDVVSV